MSYLYLLVLLIKCAIGRHHGDGRRCCVCDCERYPIGEKL